jgi:hypothetical protein
MEHVVAPLEERRAVEAEQGGQEGEILLPSTSRSSSRLQT